MSIREEIKSLVKRKDALGYLPTTQKILDVFEKWALKLADTPCRAGDQSLNDEIIEDGIREAFVRQTIKKAIKEAV